MVTRDDYCRQLVARYLITSRRSVSSLAPISTTDGWVLMLATTASAWCQSDTAIYHLRHDGKLLLRRCVDMNWCGCRLISNLDGCTVGSVAMSAKCQKCRKMTTTQTAYVAASFSSLHPSPPPPLQLLSLSNCSFFHCFLSNLRHSAPSVIPLDNDDSWLATRAMKREAAAD